MITSEGYNVILHTIGDEGGYDFQSIEVGFSDNPIPETGEETYESWASNPDKGTVTVEKENITVSGAVVKLPFSVGANQLNGLTLADCVVIVDGEALLSRNLLGTVIEKTNAVTFNGYVELTYTAGTYTNIETNGRVVQVLADGTEIELT